MQAPDPADPASGVHFSLDAYLCRFPYVAGKAAIRSTDGGRSLCGLRPVARRGELPLHRNDDWNAAPTVGGPRLSSEAVDKAHCGSLLDHGTWCRCHQGDRAGTVLVDRRALGSGSALDQPVQGGRRATAQPHRWRRGHRRLDSHSRAAGSDARTLFRRWQPELRQAAPRVSEAGDPREVGWASWRRAGYPEDRGTQGEATRSGDQRGDAPEDVRVGQAARPEQQGQTDVRRSEGSPSGRRTRQEAHAGVPSQDIGSAAWTPQVP